MSLVEAAEWFASIDRSSLLFEVSRCLHSQDRYSECEACFNICPVDAIEPAKPPRFDSQKCQTCLACMVVCPLGAYLARDAVTSLFKSLMYLEGDTIELLCAKNQQSDKGVSEISTGIILRGCLAGLGSAVYLSLVALDLKGIFIRTDGCLSCEWASLASEIRAHVGKAKNLLKTWNKADILTEVAAVNTVFKRPLWHADNPPLSRRGLFQMIARQGQVALRRVMEEEVHASSHSVGRERLRFLSAIAHLPNLNSEVGSNMGEFGFASLTITEACTACGACGRACPTEALRFTRDEDEMSFKLEFSASYCIGCEICLHVCAPSAVVIDHQPTFARVFGEEMTVLHTGRLVKCRRCGILMAEQPNCSLCSLCEYRRAHPFGSANILEFKQALRGDRKEVS